MIVPLCFMMSTLEAISVSQEGLPQNRTCALALNSDRALCLDLLRSIHLRPIRLMRPVNGSTQMSNVLPRFVLVCTLSLKLIPGFLF